MSRRVFGRIEHSAYLDLTGLEKSETGTRTILGTIARKEPALDFFSGVVTCLALMLAPTGHGLSGRKTDANTFSAAADEIGEQSRLPTGSAACAKVRQDEQEPAR